MLFLLKRPSSSFYDCMRSCVVAAASEMDARVIAASKAGEEGPDFWTTQAHCQLIGIADPSVKGLGLLCRDFIAG